MTVGQNIKYFRKKLKLTQEQLAKNSGLSRNAIYNYENGRRSPDIKTLSKIAEAFGISPIELLDLDTKQINLFQVPTVQLIEELNGRDDFPIEIQWKVGK
jgi:transcriptional regulator with XRE-family HTH domain